MLSRRSNVGLRWLSVGVEIQVQVVDQPGCAQEGGRKDHQVTVIRGRWSISSVYNIPLTVLITGTSLGVGGAIPPLVVGATPFFARYAQKSSLKETAP